MIFRAIDPLSEFSFFGRLSSIVRAPYSVLKRTSSGSSPGCSRGISAVVDNWRSTYLSVHGVECAWMRCTFAWLCRAGFIILALRGIMIGRARESLLSGTAAVAQEGSRNINGRGYRLISEMCLRRLTFESLYISKTSALTTDELRPYEVGQ